MTASRSNPGFCPLHGTALEAVLLLTSHVYVCPDCEAKKPTPEQAEADPYEKYWVRGWVTTQGWRDLGDGFNAVICRDEDGRFTIPITASEFAVTGWTKHAASPRAVVRANRCWFLGHETPHSIALSLLLSEIKEREGG